MWRARLAVLLAGATALAARPPEVDQAERRSLDIELEHLHKKTGGLAQSLDRRRAHLGRRVRALYKLSQGGYLRLLTGAPTPAELFARRDGVRRVIGRDLEELGSVKRELGELELERQRLHDREAAAARLPAAEEAPLAKTEFGPLTRPVAGRVVAQFGRYRDTETGLWATRDGIELGARPGEQVHATAAGQVRWVGRLDELGWAVVIDHGGGWQSLSGRLASAEVAPGENVRAGAPIGRAGGRSIQLQLAHDGVWLDPSMWLAR